MKHQKPPGELRILRNDLFCFLLFWQIPSGISTGQSAQGVVVSNGLTDFTIN